jgi:hypothetical protein
MQRSRTHGPTLLARKSLSLPVSRFFHPPPIRPAAVQRDGQELPAAALHASLIRMAEEYRSDTFQMVVALAAPRQYDAMRSRVAENAPVAEHDFAR